ncbi:hypothetical protein ACFWFI_37955 [Streptomyces sp. NPDC060209]|uniref:hypothetical protein n=1 Tax=Streptomyces sp. NPDC060209 TaxID=3347073 RepID=UPI00365E2A24
MNIKVCPSEARDTVLREILLRTAELAADVHGPLERCGDLTPVDGLDLRIRA